jgi:putative inorganic carbon (HCO3(-)) transporter
MRDILVTAIILVWLVFILRRSHYGAYLWAWLSYMNPHKQCWGFAMNMPFAQVAFLVTAMSMFMSKEPKRIPWTRETILLVIFMLWMTLTTLMAFYSNLAWVHWEKVIKIQMGTFMTLMLVTSKERLRLFVWVICRVHRLLRHQGRHLHHRPRRRVPGAGPGEHLLRGQQRDGPGPDHDRAPHALPAPRPRPSHWVRLGLAGAMFLTTIAAFGTPVPRCPGGPGRHGHHALAEKPEQTHDRPADRRQHVTAAVSIMPPEWFERMHTIKDYEQDESALGRINAWRTAFNVAKGNVTGGGFQMYRAPHLQRDTPPNPGACTTCTASTSRSWASTASRDSSCS